jgi:hypothetical protein
MRASIARIIIAAALSVLLGAATAEARVSKCAVANRDICKEACDKVKGTLTSSSNGLSHTCTHAIANVRTDWYVSTQWLQDYAPLTRMTEFRIGDLDFGEGESRNRNTLGIGAAYHLNDWITLDIGLSAAKGSVTARSSQTGAAGAPLATLRTDYNLYMLDAGARFYVFKRPRFEHWVYVGALSAAAQPTDATLVRDGRETTIEQLPSASTLAPAAGVGMSFQASRRISPSITFVHSPRRGWSAGFLIALPIPRPDPPPELQSVETLN